MGISARNSTAGLKVFAFSQWSRRRTRRWKGDIGRDCVSAILKEET